ncbi:MAG: hypothetical protein J5998_06200 [Clostridia bacterium]|nr:hypothetical protein [Clostridia bacterium]
MRRFILILLALLLPLAVCLAEEGDEADGIVLTRFECTRGGYTRPQTYEIDLREDGYYLRENDDKPRPIDAAWVRRIQRVIEEYDMISWDGFDKSNPYVLDGEGFRLAFAFDDGSTVSASGENAFPTGYFDAMNSLDEIMEQEKMSYLAGTYRYEGEGFGGDFTITLNADGTYAFYEGPLSSYIGSGEWYVYWNALNLTEEGGLELEFMFEYEDDALLFYAAGSDDFPYVTVPDMGRFLRVDGAAEKDGRMVVGADIAMEDITEFYYTYSSSTFPPDYQRYRFYVDDEARLFYHETRAGDHWPLTEEDVTVSGTMELSEAQWTAFFECLSGGTVKRREEHLESGDAGPWLYLYWKGDEGSCQEFAFPSWVAGAAFEAFCAELKEQAESLTK